MGNNLEKFKKSRKYKIFRKQETIANCLNNMSSRNNSELSENKTGAELSEFFKQFGLFGIFAAGPKSVTRKILPVLPISGNYQIFPILPCG